MSSLLAFNRVYKLEIQSIVLVFSTPFVNSRPSSLLTGSVFIDIWSMTYGTSYLATRAIVWAVRYVLYGIHLYYTSPKPEQVQPAPVIYSSHAVIERRVVKRWRYTVTAAIYFPRHDTPDTSGGGPHATGFQSIEIRNTTLRRTGFKKLNLSRLQGDGRVANSQQESRGDISTKKPFLIGRFS
jgi:hypothetical protein